jgi:hypothetical protein
MKPSKLTATWLRNRLLMIGFQFAPFIISPIEV